MTFFYNLIFLILFVTPTTFASEIKTFTFNEDDSHYLFSLMSHFIISTSETPEGTLFENRKFLTQDKALIFECVALKKNNLYLSPQCLISYNIELSNYKFTSASPLLNTKGIKISLYSDTDNEIIQNKFLKNIKMYNSLETVSFVFNGDETDFPMCSVRCRLADLKDVCSFYLFYR